MFNLSTNNSLNFYWLWNSPPTPNLVLGVEPKGTQVLGKLSSTELQPQLFLFSVLRQGLAKWPRLAWHLYAFCLHHLWAGITGVHMCYSLASASQIFGS